MIGPLDTREKVLAWAKRYAFNWLAADYDVADHIAGCVRMEMALARLEAAPFQPGNPHSEGYHTALRHLRDAARGTGNA